MGTSHSIVVQPFELVSVMNYGAHADGVTDDSDHVHTGMVDAISEGKVLFFPPGTYLLNTKLTMHDGASFAGVGDASILKGTVNPTSNNIVESLKFELGETTPSNEKYFGASDAYSDGAVSHLYVLNCTFSGHYAWDSGEGRQIQLGNIPVSYVLFDSCTFLQSTYNKNNQIRIWSDCDATDCYMHHIAIRNCHFDYTSRMNLEITGANSSCAYPWHDIIVDNCTFDGAGNQNISIVGYGCHDITITDNVLLDANVNPILNQGEASLELGNFTNLILTGNHVGQTAEGTTTGSHVKFMLGQWIPDTEAIVNNNWIENNIFDGRLSTSSQIWLKGSGWTFKDNTVYTCSSYGSYIMHGDDQTIQGNSFYAWDVATQNIDVDNYAVNVQNTDGADWTENHFYSKESGTPVRLHYTCPNGDEPNGPSINNTFTDCTFHRKSTAVNVKADTSTPPSSFTESGSTVVEI